MKLDVNGVEREVDAPGEMPLLWVLRDLLGLTGVKFGCGMAQCGACTVHLDGKAARSCVLPVAAVGARKVTTIEGLGPNGDHPVQRAWAEVDVVQCGYCQSGQIMSAVSLLAVNPNPSDEDPKRNGGLDMAALVKHVSSDPLVLWGWAPGPGRQPVPIAHATFVAAFETWAKQDGPCPAQ